MSALRFLVICLVVFISTTCYGENAYLPLSGHLDENSIERAQERLKEIKSANYDQLIIEVSSTSGNLEKVLSLAKQIYEIKRTWNLPVTVYINENAIGPSAVIPFLADQLYTSYFVTWGDIPLGSSGEVPTNLLRNQVASLIPESAKNSQVLSLIAQAMVDKEIIVIDGSSGWTITRDEETKKSIVSAKGETLVVNHKQLKELGLLKGIESLANFRKQSMLREKETPKEPTQALQGIDEKLKKHIPTDNSLIGYIKIDDRKTGINSSTWIYVKSALEYYKEKKPAFIILELNTPGGEVFAAQKISDALKEMDTLYDIPIVTYIDNWAISAGAMLAYSTRFITITKDAAMGAAEPVLQTSEGMQAASEKVNSALRADFANRAGFFGRNQDIAEAMVDKDIILVWRHGKVVRLDSEDQIQKTGPDRDEIITTKGKLLTLKADDLMKYDVADIKLAPAKLKPVTKTEEQQGKWPASKELLFEYPFFQSIPDATVDAYQMDWKTRFFSILAHPIVSSMLFLALMLGFYVEINSPGFGFPGTVGLIALILIVLSSFAFEAIGFLEMILIAVGGALIAIDLFLIPSFGLMGGAGILFLIVGVMGLLIPGLESVDYDVDTNTFNAAGDFAIERLAWLCGTFILGLGIIAILAKYVLPKSTAFNRFVLQGSEEEGFIAGEDVKSLPAPGAKGTVVAMLRPGGKVEIHGKVYDAMSSGEFIDNGASIVVEYLDGNNIVVGRE